MASYEAAPRFAAGQPLSAGGHLNALGRCIQNVHDDLLGPHMPFDGGESYKGAIRHKYDTLDWSYEILAGGATAWLTYNNVEIPGTRQTGTGIKSGSADLSSLSLTVDEFYVIELKGTAATTRVWLLRETPGSIVMALGLATFADGTTPSAAQWQAMSTEADRLHSFLAHPYTPIRRTNATVNDYAFMGTFTRRCKYLQVEAALRRPSTSNSGARWTEATVFINDTSVGSFRHGSPDGTPGCGSEGYTLSIDLDTCGVSLPAGLDYQVRVAIDTSTPGDWFGGGKVFSVMEFPADTPAVAGWTAIPTWAHGDYVYGNTTAKNVTILKNNLALLFPLTTYYNYPCAYRAVTGDWRFSMRRRHRYLHYRGEPVVAGESRQGEKIAFYYLDQEKDVSLTQADDTWKVFDLDGAGGLYPGTYYLIAGAQYAIEDDTP